MKYFLVFTLVMVGLWLWRKNRRTNSHHKFKQQVNKSARLPTVPTEIVACDVCHVHLPRAEALISSNGVYCSTAHRQQAGQ